MTDYNQVNKIKRLAKKLGVDLTSVDLNVRRNGDVQFVYADNFVTRYYTSAEIGFQRETERLNNFIRAAEMME